jgi:AcrR family transcriptional regulator
MEIDVSNYYDWWDIMGIDLLPRKEQLILTTIDIINDLGIQKLTTREIAKRQNISEATIFRHFNSKNELLSSTLDYFVQFDKDILQTARLRKLKPLQALLFFGVSLAEYYENYPAITAILHLFDVMRYESELADKVLEIQNGRVAVLHQLVEEAVKEEEIGQDIDSEMLAIVILGAFKELCLNWRLSWFTFSLRERTQVMLEKMLNIVSDIREDKVGGSYEEGISR